MKLTAMTFVAFKATLRTALRSLADRVDAVLHEKISRREKTEISPGNVWSFFVNLASFVTFCIVAFSLNFKNLFLWRDGTYLMILAKQQLVWGDMGLGFTGNVFQGLGNIWLPYNLPLIPGYLLPMLFNGGEVDPVSAYVIFSVELFVMAYVLSRCMMLSRITSTFAAWLLPLAAMPILYAERIYPVMYIVPSFSTLMASTVFILVLYFNLGREGRIASVACVVGIGLLISHMMVSQALTIVFAVPVLLIFGAMALAASRRRTETGVKVVAVVGFTVALLTVGAAEFQYGLYRYSAAMFFSPELLNNRGGLYDVSILFHYRAHSAFGPALFLLGAVGATLTVWRGTGIGRAMAIGTLAAMVAILAFGLISSQIESWRGPVALYFEFLLWPFYAVFSVIAIVTTFKCILAALDKVILLQTRFAKFGALANANGVIVAALPWLLIFAMPTGYAEPRAAFSYPPSKTPISAILKQEIGLSPGGVYHGRVATFTEQANDKPISWSDLAFSDYMNSVTRYNNDHRMEGFWYEDIPTLAEYSQVITPPAYLVMRQFLARPIDRQIRNVMTLRHIDPRILKMMGVRFFVSDAPASVGAKLRTRTKSDDGKALFLYELDNANIGQYSPATTILVSDAHSTLNELSKPNFDPAQSVLVDQLLPTGIVPLSESQVRVWPGQLQLSATSTGTSVMLLPFEYSRCLKLSRISNETPEPTFFRANLFLTGVLFTGKLDATLRFSTGPFQNTNCRLQDINDMKRLNVQAEAKPPA